MCHSFSRVRDIEGGFRHQDKQGTLSTISSEFGRGLNEPKPPLTFVPYTFRSHLTQCVEVLLSRPGPD